MILFQFAGLIVTLGLALALWMAVGRAKLPKATWADKAVAWYLAFATVWVLVAALRA